MQRFEQRPNELWQMDFKGHVATGDGGRCHPLTILDDHSRFNVLLPACADERLETVRSTWCDVAPLRHARGDPVDNGPPWGSAGARWTRLGAWLVHRGVEVLHSRPYHPQTQGKNERFHRTLQAEAIAHATLARRPRLAGAFDAWRDVYNLERPHEALDRGAREPLPRQRPSDAGASARGDVRRGRHRAQRRHHQGLRQLQEPALESAAGLPRRTRRHQAAHTGGHYAICFGARKIAHIDLTPPRQVSAMSPNGRPPCPRAQRAEAVDDQEALRHQGREVRQADGQRLSPPGRRRRDLQLVGVGQHPGHAVEVPHPLPRQLSLPHLRLRAFRRTSRSPFT